MLNNVTSGQGSSERRIASAELDQHRRLIWGLGYRMLGSAADADDLVQETFVRALERPPPDVSRPMRPWLVRVAANLARDRLRARKAQSYPGQWLPSPIPTAGGHGLESLGDPAPGPEVRYGALESVSFAFLRALEALSPQQRAVLLLRDVLDLSVRETSAALDLSEANVKVSLHRARRAMSSYDEARPVLDAPQRQAIEQALAQLFSCVVSGDVDGVVRVLDEKCEHIADSGGKVHASRRVLAGALRVARFLVGVTKKHVGAKLPSARFVELNGVPGVLIEGMALGDGFAERAATMVELGPDGRVLRVYQVLAPRKLLAVWPDLE
ncbi:MAG: sigma-70 family RNA polymerase sigma factor [Myxococcales bacterium]|nr:sigma-70 family RNA polymerase sigma factor [Myxococcales bacterium]